jgi:hypothetical protein
MEGSALSPLAEIERAVQERAKDISLEMSGPDGEAKLRGLIADEVARWNDDHRRGRRALALPDPDAVVERALRNLARHGPLTPLLDDDVWEIMVNAPDSVFVRRHDPDFGVGFMKPCTSFPYPAKVWINGHEWAKRQADRTGLGYRSLARSARPPKNT